MSPAPDTTAPPARTPRSRPVVARGINAFWGPHGREAVTEALRSLPAGLGAHPVHLLLVDPMRQVALWAGSVGSIRETPPEAEVSWPPGILPDERSAADVLAAHPAAGPLFASLDVPAEAACLPVRRVHALVGVAVVAPGTGRPLSARDRAALQRHLGLVAATLQLAHRRIEEQRELDGYRALSHLLDADAPRDRRALASALGKTMAAVTQARQCIILARDDASSPLVAIGSRGYPARKASALVLWPQDEPWASLLGESSRPGGWQDAGRMTQPKGGESSRQGGWQDAGRMTQPKGGESSRQGGWQDAGRMTQPKGGESSRQGGWQDAGRMTQPKGGESSRPGGWQDAGRMTQPKGGESYPIQVATKRLDRAWQEVLGGEQVLAAPIYWRGTLKSVLIFPADPARAGGVHLLDPVRIASVGAHAGLLWQNAELIGRLRRDEEVLQGLMQRAIQVQEEERRRIASDIHDGVTQRVVSIWYRILNLEKLMGRSLDEAYAEVATIKQQLDATLQEARSAIYNLRPSTLDDLGLVPSLRSLAHEFEHETGVTTIMQVRGERRLPGYVEVGIYRIVQEALRNVKKHAQARFARVSLHLGDETVRLTVSDDGRGFQRKRGRGTLKSFGLESMEERAQMLGAELFVRSNPGEGTMLRVAMHVPPEATE